MGQVNVVLLQVGEAVEALVDDGDGFSSRCVWARLKVLCDDIEDGCLRRLRMPGDRTAMRQPRTETSKP